MEKWMLRSEERSPCSLAIRWCVWFTRSLIRARCGPFLIPRSTDSNIPLSFFARSDTLFCKLDKGAVHSAAYARDTAVWRLTVVV